MATTDRRADVAPTWPLNVAIVLCLAVAFAGLNSILAEASWWFVAAGIICAVSFAIAAVRSLTRWPGWGPLAGLATLLVCLTFSFAPNQALIGFVPTIDSLTQFSRLMDDGSKSISSQGIPAEPTTGIVFMLAAGAGVLTIVCDAVVLIARRPALVGVPLVVLLAVPTIFDPSLADPWIFVLTAAAYLLLLYLGIGEARTGGALGVAASALAVALVLPVVFPAGVPDEPSNQGRGFTIGVNTFISLGENLRRPTPTRVLTYTTTAPVGQYLTVSSIDNFSGAQWRPAAPGATTEPGGLLDIGPVPGLTSDVAVEEAVTTVDIVNMGGRFAPVPYAPSRIIGLTADWGFDADTLTVSSTGDSARGAEYEVVSVAAAPSIQQLRAAGPVPEGFERYLALPEGLSASVADTARLIEEEAGATTAIDRAIALQSYFTDGTFEYSEEAPVEEGYDGTSAEVVGRFLEAKSGYCVHFSSAMAVMARSLGIPARIAVGFTPGDYQSTDESVEAPYYVVTTADLHAWPELYFDGVGWVRFEPTVGRGDLPVFPNEDSPSAAPTSAPSPTPSNSRPASASASPSASPSPSAQTLDTGVQLSSIIAVVSVGALALGAIVVLLLPLLPAIVRVSRRARRYWRIWRQQSSAAAWAELSDTAIDLGWRSAATTPREFEHLVRPGMSARSTEALERLRDAIEHTAYSRTPQTARIADVRVARRAMARASSKNDRIRARLSPRSVVLRGWRRR